MGQPPCLIFGNYEFRPTDGGPSGFLAQNVLGHESDKYRLGRAHGQPPESLWRQLREGYFPYNRARSLRAIGLNHDSYWATWLLSARHSFRRENGRAFSYVWFHDVCSAAACLDLLRPEQKLILQPHCPELPSEEFAATMNAKLPDIEWTQRAERRAFLRANVVVLPNPHARCIYESLLKPNVSVEYILSGCEPLRTTCLLPLDQKYVYYLFLGRRNRIKGFDIIVKAFFNAYQTNDALRLILVGSGEPVSHPGVVDIGRTENPGLWISNADYFISANRQSYFDLSVMEALSVGTPVIMACTGGHQFYANQKLEGLIPLANADVDLLTNAILNNGIKRTANSLATSSNRVFFEQHLSSQHYRHRLNQVISKIVSNQ